MNDALMAVVEKTTTDVFKLKELDKMVVKLHCGDREKNHQSRRDYRYWYGCAGFLIAPLSSA